MAILQIDKWNLAESITDSRNGVDLLEPPSAECPKVNFFQRMPREVLMWKLEGKACEMRLSMMN
jgi:hypothetical protein